MDSGRLVAIFEGMIYDVGVVGAGVSGLTAAAALAKRGKKVLILEARSRPGGRISTLRIPGHPPLELGAEFVHGDPQPLLTALRQARARVGNAEGAHLGFLKGKLGPAKSMERAHAVLASAHGADRSVAALIREELGDDAATRAMARAYAEGFYAARADTASALAVGRMARVEEEDGDSLHRVLDGYDTLVSYLTGRAKDAGAVLHLRTEVKRIRQLPGGGVELTVPGGGIQARAVVVTLPVGVLRQQKGLFPGVPSADQPWRKLAMGNVIKVILRFRADVPWRRRGFSMLHAPALPFPTLWRIAPFESETLVAWAAGAKADALHGLSADVLERRARGTVARLFGLTPAAVARLLDGVDVVNWEQDPHARGAYAVIPVGAVPAWKQLSARIGKAVYFAGEATDLDAPGTVHGAMRSGERVAREVLAAG